MDGRRILRQPTVRALSGMARSSLYRAIADGLFPPPVRIGARGVGWVSDEVAAIVNARVAGRSDDEIRALVVALQSRRGEESRSQPSGRPSGSASTSAA